MYWVFGLSMVCCLLLIVPQMDIRSPGGGVMAVSDGTIVAVTPAEIILQTKKTGKRVTLKLNPKAGDLVSEEERNRGLLVLPRSMSWHESIVQADQPVKKKELLARGITQIFFQANIWVFTILSFILGAVMGIGKAAVYKHIPDYFPADVGVVGGIVGVLGGLGGFFCPVLFGYLLQITGLWTSCWMFFAILIAICLVWMHLVIQKMMRSEAPKLYRRLE